MKIYTKSGDNGETSLFSGERVLKDSARVEAYGTIDELSAIMGLARTLCQSTAINKTLYDLQKLLGKIMAEVATLTGTESPLTAKEVGNIERLIDEFSAQLLPLNHFLISGDDAGSAALEVARTVVRRAERQLWRLHRQEPLNENVLIAINRLSDLCFVLYRVEGESEAEL